MIAVSDISADDVEVARGLMANAADVALSTGARAAASGAKRVGDLETWTFQRTEDVESLLALLEDYRRHWHAGQAGIHSVDRLIAKLTAALL